MAGVIAAVGISAAVLAQDNPQSILPPGFNEQVPAAATNTTIAGPTTSQPSQSTRSESGSVVVSSLSELTAEEQELALLEPVPQIELPAGSERDPRLAGPIPAGEAGFGETMWGGSSGKFLSRLMRSNETPLASRWGHILLRNALLTAAPAPSDVHPADWAAERAWLLLRMGEADGARLLVSGVDVADFSPKMFQVAAQSALANGDPSALCPLQDGLEKVERKILPLVRAMCASLSGSNEVAASDIDSARRRGSFQPIDLALADKVVGAGADTSRSSTVEWEPVDQLNIWRFGLATATGAVPPERLMGRAPPRMLAWQARSPIISPEAKLAAARVATGLGVFSSQALIDLYSLIYDTTDASDLGETDAWQYRLAMVGRDQEERVGAIRKLLQSAKTPLEKEATRAALARAASRIVPNSDLQDIAPDLIAAMLAGGYDREAQKWASVIDDMDDEQGDRCWAMLALGAPDFRVGGGDLAGFIGNDESPGRQRSALLVAGLAGIGRISAAEAGRLNKRYGFGLGRSNEWTRMIDGASSRGQSGTVAILAGTGLQADDFNSVPALHVYHLVTALNRNGQQFAARMIAAEALART
ncbi:hypothetical protein G7076_02520 [Sphingomonas sp. HDW15A]|uniref:hypothetical protein n=1 Tax=Sphingomonas sp. HDW15A TaxID=2714942 RepID=UPI00140D1CAD|nr:hypothetical protein [Sphingomonas sp. HDW15A]QIK95506.1 hypothetical protein G7076_02520 [Sphingomonas sp. HDW15A]